MIFKKLGIFWLVYVNNFRFPLFLRYCLTFKYKCIIIFLLIWMCILVLFRLNIDDLFFFLDWFFWSLLLFRIFYDFCWHFLIFFYIFKQIFLIEIDFARRRFRFQNLWIVLFSFFSVSYIVRHNFLIIFVIF